MAVKTVVKEMLEYSMMSHVDLHLFVYKLGGPRCPPPPLRAPWSSLAIKGSSQQAYFRSEMAQRIVHPKTTGIISQEITLRVAEYWKCSTK